MKTLKQFLQDLSFKRNRSVSRSAKGLLQAIKRSPTALDMLDYKINDEEIRDVLQTAKKEP